MEGAGDPGPFRVHLASVTQRLSKSRHSRSGTTASTDRAVGVPLPAPEAPSRPVPGAAVIAPADDRSATAALEIAIDVAVDDDIPVSAATTAAHGAATTTDGSTAPTTAAHAATTATTGSAATTGSTATTGSATATGRRRGGATAANGRLSIDGREHHKCRRDGGGDRSFLQHKFLSRRAMRVIMCWHGAIQRLPY